MTRTLLLWIVLTAVLGAQAGRADDPQAVFNRAVDDFFEADINASARGFDRVVELAPQVMPTLWQRGIVLYYAERYTDCREQFESHRTVNPNDVENAAWHFLCVARQESPERARELLLPVGPDSRVPMREVYELYAGDLGAEDVMRAAGDRLGGEFYAHLYLGLYAEALGDDARALDHSRAAASERFARVGGYMYRVAQVHLTLLERNR